MNFIIVWPIDIDYIYLFLRADYIYLFPRATPREILFFDFEPILDNL